MTDKIFVEKNYWYILATIMFVVYLVSWLFGLYDNMTLYASFLALFFGLGLKERSVE